jgi:putative addiction module CopG family antidote
MPSKHTMNVSLTPQLCEFISEQVASGRFRTSSEVVRAAMRMLEKEVTESGLSSSRGVAHTALADAKARKPAKRSRSPRS